MIRFTSIVLSILLLSQSISFKVDDMLRMGELLEHAQFHSSKYGDNFLVFLSKHYGQLQDQHNQENQDEGKQHEQLPFNHQSCSHTFSAFVLNKMYTPPSKSEPVIHDSSYFSYSESCSQFEKPAIFQPPQRA